MSESPDSYKAYKRRRKYKKKRQRINWLKKRMEPGWYEGTNLVDNSE